MVGALLLLLLALPFVELFLFVKVAGTIGFLGALLAIVAFGVLGTWLVKRQGFGVWRRARSRLEAGEVPADEAVNGVLLLAVGVFLALPGFLSDIVGVLLLVPPVRAVVRRLLFRRFEDRVRNALAGAAGGAFGARPRVRVFSRGSSGAVFDVSEARRTDGSGRSAGSAASDDRPPLGRP